MRLIFMGTPDFAVPSLDRLINDGHEICAVFTQPDKPKGRGHKLQAPPVKELALLHKLPVFQPSTLRDEAVQKDILQLGADAIVVVAYGKILPKVLLEGPKYGCINLHGSLLPKYRGAAPVQWAVINGEETSGVTTMLMGEGVDTGDMLLRAETAVGPEETSGELFERLKIIGADLLSKTIKELEKGNITPIPQVEENATAAPMLSKELSFLDWRLSGKKLHDLIRGLNPWPGAVAFLGDKRIKIISATMAQGHGEPGVLFSSDGNLLVYCGEDALILTELQTENGKRMSGKSYLAGHPLKKDDRFVISAPD